MLYSIKTVNYFPSLVEIDQVVIDMNCSNYFYSRW